MIKKIVILILMLNLSHIISGPQLDPLLHEKLAQDKEQRIRKVLRQKDQIKSVEFENNIDVTWYNLDLDFDVENKVLYGAVDIKALVNYSPVKMMGLNIWHGLMLDSIIVRETGGKLGYSFKGSQDLMLIALDREYSPGETINYCIYYHGRPQDSDYNAFDFNGRASSLLIWSLSEPYGARSWWPCKDVPSDKADSVDIRLTVPNNLVAVSNGTLRSKTTIGDKTTWWWHEQYPIATYLVSVAIHEYDIHYDEYIYNDGADTMAIEFYNKKGLYETQKDNLDKVKHMIGFLSDIYGQYPFIEEKYGHADFEGGGAMEHQTCSSFSFWGEAVFIHELAHQWCGDLITCDSWEHIWLNEGFASYSESLWYEYIYPDMTASDYQMGANHYISNGTVYVEDPLTEPIFDAGLSYNKGSWVLHMLRNVVGDSTFFKILKEYFGNSEFRFSTATTEQFRDLCKGISGIELDTFFHQWIYKEGYPIYNYSWDWEPLENGQYRVFGTIQQTQQRGPVFEMPIDITVTTINGDSVFRFNNISKVQDFEFFVDAMPNQLELDKDNWILKEVKYQKNPEYYFHDFSVVATGGIYDNRIESGEKVQVQFALENNTRRINNAQITFSTSDKTVQVLEGDWTISDWKAGQIITNDIIPFEFTLADNAQPHIARFKLSIVTDLGQTETLDFNYPVDFPVLLYVNDCSNKAIDSYFINLLDHYNLLYEKWDVAHSGLPDLSSYQMVLWATGDEVENTLTNDEQTVIKEYLDNGGRLLLTGQNIGQNLVENGTEQDSVFYQNILHAFYDKKIDTKSLLKGTNGTFFCNAVILSHYDDKSNIETTSLPEAIRSVGPAQDLLEYGASHNTAGLYHSDSTTDAKLVYLAFGMENVSTEYNPDYLLNFINGILIWFTDSKYYITNIDNNLSIPTQYSLKNNYPNPFNPETVITFGIPEYTRIKLEIFDVMGRKVKTLINQQAQPGEYSVTWNGKDEQGATVSSGTYFYRLSAPKFTKVKKLLFLK